MLGPKLRPWLLFLFALQLRRSKCLTTTSQETDRPNLDSAMVGFDPFVANAYEQFEPGFKNIIFDPAGNVFTSKFNTYSLPNEFSNYFTCALQFTSTVLTNFSHYRLEKQDRFFTTRSETGDMKHALNNVKDDSLGDLEDMEEKIIREFFLETNGEIVQSKITCIAQELTVIPFSVPVFTADFSAALKTLQLAAMNSDPEYSKKTYRKFVDMYGTHYMKKSKMGAEIIFHKLFPEKEMDYKAKHARQNCLNSLAQSTTANGATLVETVISDFSKLSETCDCSSRGKEYFNNSTIKSTRVIINGPPPIGTMEQWNTAVQQFPIPTCFELEKLSSLFLRNRIESSLFVGDETNLCEATSSILLYNLFESEYSEYCKTVGGKHCSPEMVSFSANSGCPPGSKCNKVKDYSNHSDVYKCTTSLVDIGGIIITGGWDDSTRLSNVETINTWQLPNLPRGVSDHTLSQVGSKLYNCGGVRTDGLTDDCHSIDLSSRRPVWESSSNMPKAMKGHVAVTIGSHIWFTHNNQLYDFGTEEQLFRTYRLPTVAPLYHCAVSNNTHSYIIGAGADNTEIWVNKYPSRPAEWLLVAHLRSARREQGCLWFKDNVFIAGGRSSGPSVNDVELLNTKTNTVAVTGSLLRVRDSPVMFILDGEPALAGGHNGRRHLDTIETFNISTNTWKASDRKLWTAMQLFGLVQLRE